MSEPSEAETPPEESGEEEEAETPRPRPRKKRKKKKRRAKSAEAAESDESATHADDDSDAASPGEPDLPGEGTPEGDRLRAAYRSFEVGDYGAVRAIARGLEDTAGPEVASAAQALRKRVEIDPIQVVVLSCCAAVVVAIMYVWIL
ncbi:MAG: hypothetical protein AB8I08_03555 [Sandaracinaceae bacterium]